MPARTFDRNGDHSPTAKAELQSSLRRAVILEAKVCDEVERLLSLAFEQGWTDDEVGTATGLTLDEVKAARDGRKHIPTIFCKGCNVPIPRSGKRGQPRQWCTRCKP